MVQRYLLRKNSNLCRRWNKPELPERQHLVEGRIVTWELNSSLHPARFLAKSLFWDSAPTYIMVEGTNGINNTRGPFVLPSLFHQMKPSKGRGKQQSSYKRSWGCRRCGKGGRKETSLGNKSFSTSMFANVCADLECVYVLWMGLPWVLLRAGHWLVRIFFPESQHSHSSLISESGVEGAPNLEAKDNIFWDFSSQRSLRMQNLGASEL